MPMVEIPKIPLPTLKVILSYLPEPTRVEVRVMGMIPLPDLSDRLGSLIPGARVENSSGFTSYLEHPTKSHILEAYRLTQEINHQELAQASEGKCFLIFRKAEWKEGLHTFAELTPHTFTFRYGHTQPSFVKTLRETLSEAGLIIENYMTIRVPHRH